MRASCLFIALCLISGCHATSPEIRYKSKKKQNRINIPTASKHAKLEKSNDFLKRKYSRKGLTEPVVGVGRDRLTNEELSQVQSVNLLSNEHVWNAITVVNPGEDVGLSGDCIGDEITVDADELDFQGNRIGFTQARRKIPLEDGNKCQIELNFPNSVVEGDNLFVQFYIKPLGDYTNTSRKGFCAHVYDSATSYTLDYGFCLPASHVWHKMQWPIRFASNSDYRIEYRYSKESEFEFGGVTLDNYQDRVQYENMPELTVYYDGMEPDAPWRAEAEERINRDRKADFQVTVIDVDGNHLRGEELRIEQVEHEFKIGAALNNKLWKQAFPNHNLTEYNWMLDFHTSIFNMAGDDNGYKWRQMTNSMWIERLRYNEEYFLANGIFVRGHAIHWPKGSTTASAVWNEVLRLEGEGDEAGAKQYLYDECIKRIDDAIEETKNYIYEWDVINELPDGRDYFGQDLIEDGDGRFDKHVQIEWLDRMKEKHPDMVLGVNDYVMLREPSDAFGTGVIGRRINVWNDLIDRATAAGHNIELFGLQGHFKELLGINHMIGRLARIPTEFTKSDLRFEVTEFDLRNFNEDVHARYMHDLLTIFFADKHYYGFNLWHWYNRDGEGRFVGEFALKTHFKDRNVYYKSGAAIKNFFHYKHWIHPMTVRTDTCGKFSLNAYFGTYKITVGTDEYYLDLKAGTSRQITVQLS